MTNKSRNKGDREEREVINLLRSLGVSCERTLESGKRPDGSNTWDITIYPDPNSILRGECKVRADGFKQIYDWLKNDFLTIRADRKERLYVIPERFFIKLLLGLKK